MKKDITEKQIDALDRYFIKHKYITRALWFDMKHKVFVKHLNNDDKPKKKATAQNNIFNDFKMPRFKI